MNFKGKKTIILEGGGFKTSFSAGVLDAFRMTNFDDFDVHIGVSGGSLALSYFLSEQYGDYYASMKTLCRDTRFIKLKKAFSDGLMNLDFFYDIAEKEFPFHLEKAVNKLNDKEFYIVLTNSLDGSTIYRQPSFDNWIDMTIAASTVPVITKGKHYLDGIPYSDGGITDPIPIKWAVENGADDIVLIRTTHQNFKPGYLRPELVAAQIIRDNPPIKAHVENYQYKLKESVDFANQLEKEINLHQIAPAQPLTTNIYTYSVSNIIQDYRYGLHEGLIFVNKQRNMKVNNFQHVG